MIHSFFHISTLDPRAKLICIVLLTSALMALPWGYALWSSGVLLIVWFLLSVTAVRNAHPEKCSPDVPPFGERCSPDHPWSGEALSATESSLPRKNSSIKSIFLRLTAPLFALGWMFALTIIIHGFTTPGHVLWEIRSVGLNLTEEGVYRGLLFSGRLAAVMLAVGSIAIHLPPLKIIQAFLWFAEPLRRLGVPVGSPALSLALALRFVPAMYDEVQILRKALLVRGWKEGRGLMRVRAWIPLIIPLLVSGLRRADDVALSLVVRGFQPSERRTAMYPLTWGAKEMGFVLVSCLPFVVFFASIVLQ